MLFPLGAEGVVLDRIAAIVDREVITVSELDQMVLLGLLPRKSGESESEYRRRILDAMVAQTLHFREVERFGAEDVPADAIESRLRQVIERFDSEEEYRATLARLELSEETVRTLLKRQLQVEAYIEERFSPLIFISLEEIERYYRETWLPQRRERGLSAVPLSEAREEIRALLRLERLQREISGWTEQLRSRANVDIYTTTL